MRKFTFGVTKRGRLEIEVRKGGKAICAIIKLKINEKRETLWEYSIPFVPSMGVLKIMRYMKVESYYHIYIIRDDSFYDMEMNVF